MRPITSRYLNNLAKYKRSTLWIWPKIIERVRWRGKVLEMSQSLYWTCNSMVLFSNPRAVNNVLLKKLWEIWTNSLKFGQNSNLREFKSPNLPDSTQFKNSEIFFQDGPFCLNFIELWFYYFIYAYFNSARLLFIHQ